MAGLGVEQSIIPSFNACFDLGCDPFDVSLSSLRKVIFDTFVSSGGMFRIDSYTVLC